MLKKIIKKILRIKSPLDVYSYNIDQVDENLIAGWAFKKVDSKHIPKIEIMSNDQVIWTTSANIYREDLKDAGIGNGKYGFNFDIAKLKNPGNISKIDIFIDGLKANSKGISFRYNNNITKIKTSKNTEIVSKVSTKDEKPEISIHVDAYSLDRIVGWAKNNSSLKSRPLVELKLNGIVVGQSKADRFREDLKTAEIGDGCHGFLLKPLVHLFSKGQVSCEIFIDGKNSNISPITLEVSQEKLDRAIYLNEFSPEMAEFTNDFNQELERLKTSIITVNKSNNQPDENISGALNVAIEGITELSVRVATIENILTKYFSERAK